MEGGGSMDRKKKKQLYKQKNRQQVTLPHCPPTHPSPNNSNPKQNKRKKAKNIAKYVPD